MSVATRVRMTGPLTCYAEGFRAELTALGYTDLSLANQLRVMADLSRWLEAQRIAVEQIDRDAILAFVAKRRRSHTQFISQRALAPLLRHLEAAGVVEVAPVDAPRRSELLQDYERYLIEERAVTPSRRELCLTIAHEFLDGRRVERLTTADVTRVVGSYAGRPGFSGWLSGLRSILRYLFAASKTAVNLVHAVPSSPRWSQRTLPQALEPGELRAVLATCDRRTSVGRRDFAVLLLLSRLGLRACEVAALRLDDVDWKAGEIMIRGKGRSLSRLPLPVDVGHAMASYLRRARREPATRSVFRACRAPYRSLTSSAAIAIARTALRAAGVDRGGAHRLRHTAATQMLRRGASLTEIAQVLRHRHVNTTAIYAKVDRNSLCALVRCWPVDRPDPERVRELAQPWTGGVA